MGAGSVRQRLGTIALTAAVAALPAGLLGCGENRGGAVEQRPDVAWIDALASFGALERGPVAFRHDLHVEKLQEQNLDCSACHLRDSRGVLSQKFQRLEESDKQTVMALYHRHCTGCHQTQAARGAVSAPVTCDGCHPRKPAVVSSRSPAGFDLALHDRHIQAEAGRCDTCHHVYDAKKQALVYVKGKESSCRDCHRAQAEGNLDTFRTVSHQACIGCHLEQSPAGQEQTLPVLCRGCHGAELRAAAQQGQPVPRLQVGQPDFVLLRTAVSDLPAGTMNTVPFDHQRHENVTPTCRACHHESLKACTECHLLKGGEQGKGITLERAMHSVNSTHSCVGCHEQQKSRKECAGCHAFMEKGKMSDATCRLCHYGPPPSEARASALPVSRPAQTELSFSAREIPEILHLDLLSGEYEAAFFPHLEIVDRMLTDIRGSSLAVHFHGRADQVCRGCHHNSPAGAMPPRCGSCHGQPFNKLNLFMPGLLGAYHQQCIGCHEQMEIPDSTGCTDCHQKKK